MGLLATFYCAIIIVNLSIKNCLVLEIIFVLLQYSTTWNYLKNKVLWTFKNCLVPEIIFYCLNVALHETTWKKPLVLIQSNATTLATLALPADYAGTPDYADPNEWAQLDQHLSIFATSCLLLLWPIYPNMEIWINWWNVSYFSFTYTVLHIFSQVLFWAENQSNHQNSTKRFDLYIWTDFNGDEAKKNQIGRLKKLSFSNCQFSIFFRENFRDWSSGK